MSTSRIGQNLGIVGSLLLVAGLVLIPSLAFGYSNQQTASSGIDGWNKTFSFTGLPPASGSVSVTVRFKGDYDAGSASSEYLDVYVDNVKKATECQGVSCKVCADGYNSKTYSVSGTYVADGRLDVRLDNSSAVGACTTYFDVRVSYTNAPTNQAPTASNQTISVTEDMAKSFQLNASDPDGDPLTYAKVSSPSNGSLTMFSGTSGQVTYKPNADFNGNDSFQWKANDGKVDSNTATVTLQVQPVNDPPKLVAPTPTGPLMVKAGNKLTFKVAGMDPDGDTLTYGVSPMPMGAMFDKMMGDFSWTPTFQDAGMKTLTLSVSDGQVQDTRMVKVNVTTEDKDGDGLPDGWESANGLDPTKKDSDGDGIPDKVEVGSLQMPADTDGDGTLDAADDDSDGDGVKDKEEAGTMGGTPVDSDNDGDADYRDTDSDNDGVKDGKDNCRVTPNNPQTDSDGDGVGDACENDRDGDGITNSDEKAAGTNPDSKDSDGDTISDGHEWGSGSSANDEDADGTPDALDEDSDGDGVKDKEEAGDSDPSTKPADTDGDGKPDYRDIDSDEDGVTDKHDNCRLVKNMDQKDSNGDGTGDACSEDADGDGVKNDVDNCPKKANAAQNDRDGDGKGDACDTGGGDADGGANTTADGGQNTTPGADAGPGGNNAVDVGGESSLHGPEATACACSSAESGGGNAVWLALFAAGVLLIRRRRRAL